MLKCTIRSYSKVHFYVFLCDIIHLCIKITVFFLFAGLILLFYLIFYIFLGGLFSLTMYVMLQTLDEHKPTWQDRLSTPGSDMTDWQNRVSAAHSVHKVS